MKPRAITDVAVKELSLIFSDHKGKEWEPINQDAQVLMVKGAEKKSKISEAFDTLKAYFSSNADLSPVQPFPVTEAEDNIDNDGDGPEDYNAIISAVCCLYNDLSSAYCISDDAARSAAMVGAIDSFLKGLDALRSGDEEKAGARHSSADMAHLKAMQQSHKEMGDHLAAMMPADKAAEVTQTVTTGTSAATTYVVQHINGSVPTSDTLAQLASDAVDKAAKKEPYGDVTYADPGYQEDKQKRYPLDTEEHVRAAASYFGMEKNRSKYSESEQKEIDARIAAAEKKFGIGKDDKAAPVAEEIDMTQDELNALVADAATKAAEAAVAKANEATQAQIEAAKAEAKAQAEAEAQIKIDEANKAAEAAKAQAAADKAAADEQSRLAEEYKAQASQNSEVLKAVAGMAVRPTATSGAAQKGGLTRLEQTLRAQLAQNPQSHQF